MKNIVPTISEVMSKVTNLDQKVANLDDKVNKLDGKVSSLDSKVSGLDSKVSNLDSKFDKLMKFLREHMVTRTDLVLLEERFDRKYAKQESLDQLSKSFDDFAKETLLERQENKIKNHRIEKMESWIEIASKKIKVPYKN